ncbi:MAG: hypothetical protein HFH14_05005 [Lachnospiraceae bacterium]|nr:hypothetical protein [Lachnospiraceae bacterium]
MKLFVKTGAVVMSFMLLFGILFRLNDGETVLTSQSSGRKLPIEMERLDFTRLSKRM